MLTTTICQIDRYRLLICTGRRLAIWRFGDLASDERVNGARPSPPRFARLRERGFRYLPTLQMQASYHLRWRALQCVGACAAWPTCMKPLASCQLPSPCLRQCGNRERGPGSKPLGPLRPHTLLRVGWGLSCPSHPQSAGPSSHPPTRLNPRAEGLRSTAFYERLSGMSTAVRTAQDRKCRSVAAEEGVLVGSRCRLILHPSGPLIGVGCRRLGCTRTPQTLRYGHQNTSSNGIG